MTGIEDFYSIEKLIIFQNNIEKINLSQNILLEELEIYDNKISEIDLSKNIKLKKLANGGNEICLNGPYEIRSKNIYAEIAYAKITTNIAAPEHFWLFLVKICSKIDLI